MREATQNLLSELLIQTVEAESNEDSKQLAFIIGKLTRLVIKLDEETKQLEYKVDYLENIFGS